MLFSFSKFVFYFLYKILVVIFVSFSQHFSLKKKNSIKNNENHSNMVKSRCNALQMQNYYHLADEKAYMRYVKALFIVLFPMFVCQCSRMKCDFISILLLFFGNICWCDIQFYMYTLHQSLNQLKNAKEKTYERKLNYA